MLKFIFFGFFLIFATILGVAVTRSDDVMVARMLHISAPPDQVYPHIISLHDWRRWSYYETIDPDMQRTYEGPQTGTGAAYAWAGRGKVGAGRMEIVEAQAPERVLIRLDLAQPILSQHQVTISLRPNPKGTLVEMRLNGKRPFRAKLSGLFFDEEQRIGKDFEVSLKNLKTLIED